MRSDAMPEPMPASVLAPIPAPIPAFTRALTFSVKPPGRSVADSPSAETAARQAAEARTTAALIAVHVGQPGALLPLLHAIQDALGFIAPTQVAEIAQALNLSRAEVHGVITYYPHFRSTAPARHRLEVCRAESCQAMGGEALAAHVQQRLGCDFHGADATGAVDLEPVYCLGLCAQSPTIALDGVAYARMTPARLDRLLDPLLSPLSGVCLGDGAVGERASGDARQRPQSALGPEAI